MIRKLTVWNNPFLSYEYYTELDFISGQAVYKTNVTHTSDFPKNSKDYECLLLLPKERIHHFLPQLCILDTWESTYGSDFEGAVIDGFKWSIKIFGECEREIKGSQCKPKEFDNFISELEILLQKDFGGYYA